MMAPGRHTSLVSPAACPDELGLNQHRSLYQRACKRPWLSNCCFSDQVRKNEASSRGVSNRCDRCATKVRRQAHARSPAVKPLYSRAALDNDRNDPATLSASPPFSSPGTLRFQLSQETPSLNINLTMPIDSSIPPTDGAVGVNSPFFLIPRVSH
ncbi:hypothetical protein BO78DRAFT_113065 [Aspergillus sclerotiicarbonarius CBS 121057]|uniref:Uncharacterized protein n=1 Tax=Aspergillus sclerotiicarbonarius (strain CBS 121057 / IBT 28362) TaxID=1448318 RepID=A0A319EB29_ASPSB|nr:hypothetical protein BO78DRAFT_113065 [Aspergillus sclerotiicarbonarius CBS 121057]